MRLLSTQSSLPPIVKIGAIVIGVSLSMALVLPLDGHADDPHGDPREVDTTPEKSSREGGGETKHITLTAEDIQRLPLGSLISANWADANQICAAAGKKLATRDEICLNGAGGEPQFARPEGDIWMAVGDHSNAWVSVGTVYPERICKLHEEVTGTPPAWGTDRGPQPITGNATAFVCI